MKKKIKLQMNCVGSNEVNKNWLVHITLFYSFSVPSLPPAPSNITSMHPLLMRQSDQITNRAVRGGRHRLRSLPVHVNLNPGSRQPNTPVILQRYEFHTFRPTLVEYWSETPLFRYLVDFRYLHELWHETSANLLSFSEFR